jgi:hypothetical protein
LRGGRDFFDNWDQKGLSPLENLLKWRIIYFEHDKKNNISHIKNQKYTGIFMSLYIN